MMKGMLRAGLSICGLLAVTAALSGTALAQIRTQDSVPEIDPGSIAGAAALLVGGIAMLADRFRKS